MQGGSEYRVVILDAREDPWIDGWCMARGLIDV